MTSNRFTAIREKVMASINSNTPTIATRSANTVLWANDVARDEFLDRIGATRS